jgi:hypothetical protein
MGKFSRLGNDLYTGRSPIDFVGAAGSGTPISAVIVRAVRALTSRA